uniref:Uncharacterized protein n=1 Tax=Anguilla anguilla TaxID=7936 RepID=A0A0E9PGA4_ANGAN
MISHKSLSSVRSFAPMLSATSYCLGVPLSWKKEEKEQDV